MAIYWIMIQIRHVYLISTLLMFFVQDNGLMPEFEPLVCDSSNKINFVYFSPEKVTKAIKKFKTNGSGGDDKLPNIFFLMLHLKLIFHCRVFLIYL